MLSGLSRFYNKNFNFIDPVIEKLVLNDCKKTILNHIADVSNNSLIKLDLELMFGGRNLSANMVSKTLLTSPFDIGQYHIDSNLILMVMQRFFED